MDSTNGRDLYHAETSNSAGRKPPARRQGRLEVALIAALLGMIGWYLNHCDQNPFSFVCGG